jgi:hypothetical protein
MCRPVICGSPYLPTSDDWVLQITNVLSSVALRAALVTILPGGAPAVLLQAANCAALDSGVDRGVGTTLPS